MVVWPLVVFVVLLIAWLYAGRVLTLAVDRVIPFPVRPLAVSPLSYHGSEFVVGGKGLTLILLNHQNAEDVILSHMAAVCTAEPWASNDLHHYYCDAGLTGYAAYLDHYRLGARGKAGRNRQVHLKHAVH